jgi:cell division protein FtsB
LKIHEDKFENLNKLIKLIQSFEDGQEQEIDKLWSENSNLAEAIRNLENERKCSPKFNKNISVDYDDKKS